MYRLSVTSSVVKKIVSRFTEVSPDKNLAGFLTGIIMDNIIVAEGVLIPEQDARYDSTTFSAEAIAQTMEAARCLNLKIVGLAGSNGALSVYESETDRQFRCSMSEEYDIPNVLLSVNAAGDHGFFQD